MELFVFEVRAEFHPGHDAHPEASARFGRLRKPVDGIVVGDGDGVQLCSGGRFHHGCGRECSIGGSRVHLQVHERCGRRGRVGHDR